MKRGIGKWRVAFVIAGVFVCAWVAYPALSGRTYSGYTAEWKNVPGLSDRTPALRVQGRMQFWCRQSYRNRWTCLIEGTTSVDALEAFAASESLEVLNGETELRQALLEQMSSSAPEGRFALSGFSVTDKTLFGSGAEGTWTVVYRQADGRFVAMFTR